jgi:integrase
VPHSLCGHGADTERVADMANGLNEDTIKALPIPDKGNRVHYFAGAVLQGIQAPRGFGVRVTAGGAKAFVLNYRLRGREYRYTIGQYPDWKALRAVREARDLRQRVDRGENPLDDRVPPVPAEAPKRVADVIDDFLKRYVRSPAGPLRSVKEYERALLKQVAPAIGKVPIYELRRSQIAEMLDTIEDGHGPVQADRTLAYFRKCLNWYASRDDRFVPPIVPGMARTRATDRARERVLSDVEIRTIWPHLTGTFGAVVKVLLLTAQRRNEVARMAWQEIDKEASWTIPAARYKTKRANVVPLSKGTLVVIEAQPKIAGCDAVFATRTRSGKGRGAEPAWCAFSGFSKTKPALDKAITAANGGTPLPNWTLHDLRRTAKTLMVRAGVRPDISERVLGHAIGGVEGVYDRHSYEAEKRGALESLAAEIERILNPSPANVVPIRQEAWA